MYLSEINLQLRVKILGCDDKLAQSKLIQFGIYPGDQAWVIRRAPFGGPILIDIGGREVALSNRLAEEILVELV